MGGYWLSAAQVKKLDVMLGLADEYSGGIVEAKCENYKQL